MEMLAALHFFLEAQGSIHLRIFSSPEAPAFLGLQPLSFPFKAGSFASPSDHSQ